MYERYCKLRDLKGLNDAKVPRYCDFPKSTFSDWKKGKSEPKISKIRKIAECLDCSIDYLVNGKDKTYSEEDALLDAHISEDVELKEAIKKYYTLDEKAKKYILEGIDLLWRANKTDTQ